MIKTDIRRVDWDIQVNERAKSGEAIFERLFNDTDKIVNALVKAQEEITEEDIDIVNKQFDNLLSTYAILKKAAQGFFADSLVEYIRVTENCLRMNDAEAYDQFPKGSKKREMADRRLAVLKDMKDISDSSSSKNIGQANTSIFYKDRYCDYSKEEKSWWRKTDKKYIERAMQ